MDRTFQGRPILPGEASGEVIVTRYGFNTLSVYYKSILTNAQKAVCNDQDNPDLYGKDLTGKIICLPKSIGSTSAGATWDRVAQMNIAPRAMLFSKQIDSLASAGLILADVWVGRRIITIDRLGDEFLKAVETGRRLEIRPDGSVTLVS